MLKFKKSIRRIITKSDQLVSGINTSTITPVDEVQLQEFLKSHDSDETFFVRMGEMLITQLEHVTSRLEQKLPSDSEGTQQNLASCFNITQIMHRLIQESLRYVQYFSQEISRLKKCHESISLVVVDDCIKEFLEKYAHYILTLLNMSITHSLYFHQFKISEIVETLSHNKRDKIETDTLNCVSTLYSLTIVTHNTIVKKVAHTFSYLREDLEAMKTCFYEVSAIQFHMEVKNPRMMDERKTKMETLDKNISEVLSGVQKSSGENEKSGLSKTKSTRNKRPLTNLVDVGKGEHTTPQWMSRLKHPTMRQSRPKNGNVLHDEDEIYDCPLSLSKKELPIVTKSSEEIEGISSTPLLKTHGSFGLHNTRYSTSNSSISPQRRHLSPQVTNERIASSPENLYESISSFPSSTQKYTVHPSRSACKTYTTPFDSGLSYDEIFVMFINQRLCGAQRYYGQSSNSASYQDTPINEMAPTSRNGYNNLSHSTKMTSRTLSEAPIREVIEKESISNSLSDISKLTDKKEAEGINCSGVDQVSEEVASTEYDCPRHLQVKLEEHEKKLADTKNDQDDEAKVSEPVSAIDLHETSTSNQDITPDPTINKMESQ